MEIEKADKQWWQIVRRGGLGALMLLARFPLPPKEVAHQNEMHKIMDDLVYRDDTLFIPKIP